MSTGVKVVIAVAIVVRGPVIQKVVEYDVKKRSELRVYVPKFIVL
jgi:hypothetical protein